MSFKEIDLDILRGLNEVNINDNPSVRELFFNSLKEVKFSETLEKSKIEIEKKNSGL